MILKKNDKIIAVVGVIILIIAAIGIVLYSQEDTEPTITPPKEEKTMFSVKVDEVEPTAESQTFTFGGGLLLKSKSSLSEEDLFNVTNDNLKSIKFNISYQDNKVGGLLGILFKGMIGNDKFQITIVDPDGTEYSSGMIRGSGIVEIEIDGINPMIDTSDIEADSMVEAEEELQSRIDDYGLRWKGQSFSMTATHQVSETLRLLLRLRERLDKDSFTVETSYNYYDYYLEESMIEDDTNDEDDNEETGGDYFDHNVGEFYANLGYGRAMI